MSAAARKTLFGIGLLLAAGAVLGWVYGNPIVGFAVAAVAALGWQLRQLLRFDLGVETGNFDAFRVGDGIWQKLFARFRHERDRAARHKSNYRQLLKEVRRSTNAMPDGSVILDENNEIVMCNRAAKKLAGLKRRKDRGQRIENILRDPKIVQLVNDGGFDRSVEIASPVRDGHWLFCQIVPYGAEQKLLIIRDVTERKRLAKMRRDFVANASHELRSPLTVITGYLDMLAEDENLPEAWADPIAQMQAQGQRMRTMLSELLELSRLESRVSSEGDDWIDVASLLEGVRRELTRAGNTPRVTVRADTDIRLRGAPSEIESVAANLLSNAIRHTPEDGSIELLWQADERGGELRVVDTGIGIAAEHLPRLTERFFRVDKGRARSDGGVGLGLAIVKHVLARHDAELAIESTPGEGSSFVCRFPARRLSAD